MWKKSKKPVYASAKYLTTMSKFKNSVVLVDLRPESEIVKSHIEGAVAISPDGLASLEKQFPEKKSAPVVIISDSEQDAGAAFTAIRGWGYKNAAILQGGMKGWQKAELPTKAGSAAAEIVYVPKPIPGAMSAKDFEAVLAQGTGDTIILDVRTEDEAAEGAIVGAINIPTDEVGDRLDEIPKGKKIVTYCATGIRAEMAYITLKDKGYDAKFLNAKTAFGEDSYTLNEN